MRLTRTLPATALTTGLLAASMLATAPSGPAEAANATRHTAHHAQAPAAATAQKAAKKPAPPRNLTRAQVKNARTIIAVGRQHRVPTRGIKIALMAALQESSLRNLNRGDRDSVGLFQQRPSQGWGKRSKLRDPVYASRAFYGVTQGTRNHGLLQIRGWKKMSHGTAAQRVQRSAYPRAYAKWARTADRLIASA